MGALLADRMLERLARRLRLMGYDVEMKPEGVKSLREVVVRAEREGRLIVTTSERLGAYAPALTILVSPGDLAEQLEKVVRHCRIDFAGRAFRRCSRDNALLEGVAFEEAAWALPPKVRQMGPMPVRRCPRCRRLYWPGTHVARIIEATRRATGVDLAPE